MSVDMRLTTNATSGMCRMIISCLAGARMDPPVQAQNANMPPAQGCKRHMRRGSNVPTRAGVAGVRRPGHPRLSGPVGFASPPSGEFARSLPLELKGVPPHSPPRPFGGLCRLQTHLAAVCYRTTGLNSVEVCLAGDQAGLSKRLARWLERCILGRRMRPRAADTPRGVHDHAADDVGPF